MTGTPLTVHPSFDAGAVMRAADEEGVTLVSLVATALQRIDPSRFRRIVLGGSAPRPPPPNVSTTYGLTETGSGVVYDGLPIDGVEVAMRDRRDHPPSRSHAAALLSGRRGRGRRPRHRRMVLDRRCRIARRHRTSPRDRTGRPNS
ncbi:MAG: hypothetical protein R2715_09040 [Ilumatobacteraceae bacterium]